MRKFLLWLLVSSTVPCVYSQTTQQSAPLSDSEKRKIADQLAEAKACALRASENERLRAREAEALERERAAWQLAIDAEKKTAAAAEHDTAVKTKELELAQDQAKFYKEAWQIATKKKSAGCWAKQILTAFIWRCH